MQLQRPEFQNFIAHLRQRVVLSDDEMEMILSKVQIKRLRKREVFIALGEVCRHEAYVNKGVLRAAYLDEKAHEHVVQFAFEDWWIADMLSFLTGQPSRTFIDALEDSELLIIDRADAEWLYEQVPAFERAFRLLLQNAFIALQSRFMDSLSLSAEVRYTQLIKRFPHLELRVAQHHIASFLGITPEALSRIRKSIVNKERLQSNA